MLGIATVGALITALAVPVARLQATAPGANGLIVYQATVGDHVQLFGSGDRQITNGDDAHWANWGSHR